MIRKPSAYYVLQNPMAIGSNNTPGFFRLTPTIFRV